jgi:hypothetical protein
MNLRAVWTPMLNRKWVRIAEYNPEANLKSAPYVEIRQEKGTSVLEFWFHLSSVNDDGKVLKRYAHGDVLSLFNKWRIFLDSCKNFEPEKISLLQRPYGKRLAEDEDWPDGKNQLVGKLVLIQGLIGGGSKGLKVRLEPHYWAAEISDFCIWLDHVENMRHVFKTAMVYPD